MEFRERSVWITFWCATKDEEEGKCVEKIWHGGRRKNIRMGPKLILGPEIKCLFSIMLNKKNPLCLNSAIPNFTLHNIAPLIHNTNSTMWGSSNNKT